MVVLNLRHRATWAKGLVALTLLTAAAPLAAAPPVAVAKINPATCAVTGNRGETTVIDWQPSDATLPVEVRWFAQGKQKGFRVVIKALTGSGEQSPDAARQKKILEMLELKYTIGPDVETVLSGLPKNPPFDAKHEVRWKYQVQVLNSQGKVVCGVDPEVCVREPGGCGN
jgi:hypothetical protein